MESRQILVGADTWTVVLDGPDTHHVVVLLPGAEDTADDFAEVSARLHNSGLRTIFVEPRAGVLDDAVVPALLSRLGLPMVNLVGRGAGADLAWRLAASQMDRFLSLVVVGRGHPAAPDPHGVVRDADCRPVEVATTVLVSENARERRWAEASGRFVYGDFRVVGVPGATDLVRDGARELTTEIVLRTSLW